MQEPVLIKSALRVKLSDISLDEEVSSHRGLDRVRIDELKQKLLNCTKCFIQIGTSLMDQLTIEAWYRPVLSLRFLDGDFNCSLFSRPSLLCDDAGLADWRFFSVFCANLHVHMFAAMLSE